MSVYFCYQINDCIIIFVRDQYNLNIVYIYLMTKARADGSLISAGNEMWNKLLVCVYQTRKMRRLTGQCPAFWVSINAFYIQIQSSALLQGGS